MLSHQKTSCVILPFHKWSVYISMLIPIVLYVYRLFSCWLINNTIIVNALNFLWDVLCFFESPKVNKFYLILLIFAKINNMREIVDKRWFFVSKLIVWMPVQVKDRRTIMLNIFITVKMPHCIKKSKLLINFVD